MLLEIDRENKKVEYLKRGMTHIEVCKILDINRVIDDLIFLEKDYQDIYYYKFGDYKLLFKGQKYLYIGKMEF